MNIKTKLQIATALAVASSVLVGYVKWQWPVEVKELDIPPGRVMTMPGGGLKGICLQGDPNGLSLWYRVTPYNSNELAASRASRKLMYEYLKGVDR